MAVIIFFIVAFSQEEPVKEPVNNDQPVLSPLEQALAHNGEFQAEYVYDEPRLYAGKVIARATYSEDAFSILVIEPKEGEDDRTRYLLTAAGEYIRCFRIQGSEWRCRQELDGEWHGFVDIRSRMREAYAILEGAQVVESARTVAGVEASCYAQDDGNSSAEYCFSPSQDPLSFSFANDLYAAEMEARTYEQGLPDYDPFVIAENTYVYVVPPPTIIDG